MNHLEGLTSSCLHSCLPSLCVSHASPFSKGIKSNSGGRYPRQYFLGKEGWAVGEKNLQEVTAKSFIQRPRGCGASSVLFTDPQSPAYMVWEIKLRIRNEPGVSGVELAPRYGVKKKRKNKMCVTQLGISSETS